MATEKRRGITPPAVQRNACEASRNRARQQSPQPSKGHGMTSSGRRSSGFAARDVLVALIFGSRVVQTVLRMAMGALVIYICEEFECVPSTKGWLLSCHAFGYCTTQILGGYVADKLGGRRLIGASMLLAGCALAATPAAASLAGLYGVCAMQVIMGVAMGPLFPASVQVLAKWLPPQERAFASTALDSGITLGSLIVVPCAGSLAMSLGWRAALVMFGSVSVLYAVLWWQVAPESPETCAFCSDEERAYLAQSIVSSKPMRVTTRSADISMDALHTGQHGFLDALAYGCLWAIYISHFAFNYGVYFINSWSATYYLDSFGVRPEDAGLHLALPHATNMLVKIFLNSRLERLLRSRGASTLECRRAFTCLGFVVPAVCLAVAPSLKSMHSTTACFSVVLGFMALHPSGFKANYMDVTRTRGGLVGGVGNTIASAASSFGPLVVANLNSVTGSWASSFYTVCVLNAASAVIFCVASSTTPIEDQE